ncbi:MAG: hypothetical protein GX643_11015 [Acidimicrobiales bacterium]|nr:hypothetical protein [Acidimicrobiales bacterium]
MDNALSEPAVVDGLSSHLTDQIFDAIPATAFVEDRLPTDMAPVAGLVVGAVRPVVHDGISRLLSDDATRQLIVGAAERSHRSAMRVLDGGSLSSGVSVDSGTVSVNLLPVVGRALELVQGAGLLTRIEVPDLDPAGDPSAQILELEELLGRSLPPDLGQLVVYDSEHISSAETLVARAQQALVLFRRATSVILIITVASTVAALALAERRRRALLLLSLGLIGAMSLGRAIIQALVSAVPALAVRPEARAAIRAMVNTMAEGLLTVGVIATVGSVATWRWLHGESGASDILVAEATAWRVAALRGAGMIVGFSLLAVVQGSSGTRRRPTSIRSWWSSRA